MQSRRSTMTKLESVLSARNNFNFFTLHFILLVTLLSLTHINADCNVCAVDTKRACVSETEYQCCINNYVEGAIFQCDVGEVCSYSGMCKPNLTNTWIDCSEEYCNRCDASRTFACKNSHEFIFCLGTNVLNPIEGTCAPGYVCNIHDDKMCVDPKVNPASCPYTLDPTSSPPSQSTDPNGFCAYVKEEGRFPVGTDLETTCQQFLRCILQGDEWIGVIYHCPGQAYYDAEKKVCTLNTPAHCGKHVRQLRLLRF